MQLSFSPLNQSTKSLESKFVLANKHVQGPVLILMACWFIKNHAQLHSTKCNLPEIFSFYHSYGDVDLLTLVCGDPSTQPASSPSGSQSWRCQNTLFPHLGVHAFSWAITNHMRSSQPACHWLTHWLSLCLGIFFSVIMVLKEYSSLFCTGILGSYGCCKFSMSPTDSFNAYLGWKWERREASWKSFFICGV